MTQRKNLFKNAFSLLIIQFSNYIAPFLVIPYLSRLLGVDGFGLSAILLSISGVLIVIIDYGFNLSATAVVAGIRDQRSRINQLLSSVLIVKLTIALFTLVGLFGVADLIIDGGMSDFLIFSYALVLFGQSLQMIWLFQGIERMKNITYVQVALKLVYVFLVFVLVQKESDIEYVIFALGLSNLIAGALCTWLIYRNGFSYAKTNLKQILHEIKYGAGFFMSRLSVAVYSQASVFVVGSFSGNIQAGLYGGCEKLYQAAQSVISPIINALFPYLVNHKDQRFFFKLVASLTLVLITGCAGCIWLSDWILALILGDEFVVAADVFIVFMCIVPISFVSMNFGYPAFALIDRVRVANITVIVGSVFHLAALVILGFLESISAINVALVILVTETLILMLRLSLFFKLKSSKDLY
jgi:PST family polysaccharide transporter